MLDVYAGAVVGDSDRRGRRLTVLAAASLLALLVPAVALGAPRDFDDPASNDASQQFQLNGGHVQREDTPNDPEYDRSEPDDEDAGSVTGTSSLFEERFDLFGFPSQLTEDTAKYREGPHALQPMVSGFNAAGAWKLSRGRSDVAVAILDTGIEWDNGGLRRKIALNAGELPTPASEPELDPLEPGEDCSTYTAEDDANGDGSFNVVDFACDQRVDPNAGADGVEDRVDGQDLIAAFGGDGSDDDDNGFVDDVAGWDFFDNDNDPHDASSYFAAANHGTGRAEEVAEQADDGESALGVCPDCQVMPVRIWDVFVSDGNTFGMGILYATDNGAEVIEGANGSLYHSAFTESASQYAYEQGVVQTYSGDDLNTANHNYPANYNHTMLIQGTVPDTIGLGLDFGEQAKSFLQGLPGGISLGTQIPVTTYFRNANTSQFGGHSSLSMEGATGSENTGKAAGAAALVISAAREERVELRPDETRVLLEQTAEDITGGPTGVLGNVAGVGLPDPAHDGWDLHFGWGRANVGRAVAVAKQRAGERIPPEASLGSPEGPDWYAPLTGETVEIKGLARARFAEGGSFDWRLEWAPGLDPEPGSFQEASRGSSDGSVTDFGEIDLDQVRAALASYVVPPDSGGPTFAPGGPHPYQQRFTVRLTVDGEGVETPGIDRKVLNAFEDETLRSGYPKRLGTGGEAPIRYADLNGDNVEELLVPLEDGTLHAYERDGSELAGWPVETGTQLQAEGHGGAPGFASVDEPPREPLRGAVVGDLDDDGRPEVISAAGTHVYAWNADGTLVDGFPFEINLSNCAPSEQSQPLEHPKCGFLATPAMAHMDGRDEPPSIVAPALDGRLYVVDGQGRSRPGFPVRLSDPAIPEGERMVAESINNPAIGDLDGDGSDDVVVATNESYGANPPGADSVAGLLSQAFADLLANAAGGSSRVYAVSGADGEFLDGWPIELNGGIQNTLPLIGPGHDAAIATLRGELSIVVSTTGGALSVYGSDGSQLRAMQQDVPGLGSNQTDVSGVLAQLNLFESAAVGDVLGQGDPAVVKYGVTISQAANLLLTGQNFPYNHLIGAYDGVTGAALPNFPTVTDDYQFLSSSTIAKVDPDGLTNQVLAGTGLGLMHAYDGATGLDVRGFPKQTGGWLFAPAGLSDDKRLAGITREGFLFEWESEAPRCQSEWPTFRHDQQSTGNYDADGTPPGAVERLRVRALGGGRYRIRFVSPGDDRLCGTPDGYRLRLGGEALDVDLGSPMPAGRVLTAEIRLPRNAPGSLLAVQAVDEVRNLGFPQERAVPAQDDNEDPGDDGPGDDGPGNDGRPGGDDPRDDGPRGDGGPPGDAGTDGGDSAGEGETDPGSADDAGTTASGGSLPFTGLALGAMVVFALALIGGGGLIRRRVRADR